jgi:hypothetical protein
LREIKYKNRELQGDASFGGPWDQAMPIFGHQLAESLALLMSKSGPKVMAFVVMKPYQLPPDP